MGAVDQVEHEWGVGQVEAAAQVEAADPVAVWIRISEARRANQHSGPENGNGREWTNQTMAQVVLRMVTAAAVVRINRLILLHQDLVVTVQHLKYTRQA